MRALILVCALTALARGEDVVHLKRGGELRGTVTSATPKEVVLELASGEIRLPRNHVARIEHDAAPADTAPPTASGPRKNKLIILARPKPEIRISKSETDSK